MRPFLPILPFLVKYPFLKVAGHFLKFEFGDIDGAQFSDREAEEEGKRWVESVLKGEKRDFKRERTEFLCEICKGKHCGEGDWIDRFKNCAYTVGSIEYSSLLSKAKRAVLAYVFAKMILSGLDERSRIKFAVEEARRYREMLMYESAEFLKFFAWDFGVDLRVVGDQFWVDVVGYIRGAVRIRAEEWKLVNRWLERGYVRLTRREFVRLMEEYIRDRLGESVGVRLKVRMEIPKGEVKAECYPPCMRRILYDLGHGLNVPHSARFAIASFLLNIGKSVEEVVDVFRTAPDFDEDKTRYQVEHIAGMRGKGEEYVCPSCETMRSYGNCFPDEGCEGINHPVKYYFRCVRKSKRKSRRASKSKSRSED